MEVDLPFFRSLGVVAARGWVARSTASFLGAGSHRLLLDTVVSSNLSVAACSAHTTSWKTWSLGRRTSPDVCQQQLALQSCQTRPYQVSETTMFG